MPSKPLVVLALAAIAAIGAWSLLEFREPAPTDRGGVAVAQTSGTPRGGAGAAAVEVAEARTEKAADDIRTVGSLQSDESVQIAPEISGRVAEITFQEGTRVSKGDVLVRLDPSLARAEVQQARARLALAQANDQRTRTLSRSGNVTDRARDEAVAAYETARAELELALTRLEKHELTAPFDGIVGMRNVSVGAYLAPGTAIVNLENLSTLKVDFRVPETQLAAIKVGQPIEVHVDALPDRTFKGTIYAINPLVDVNGRSLQVRGRIDNADGVLRPGLFARIVVRSLAQRDVVSVPESAVVPRAGDTFVYVVDADRAVERRVRLGQRRAGAVEVVEGLEPGSRVVTAGQQRLRDGARVEVVPTVEVQPRSSTETARTSG